MSQGARDGGATVQDVRYVAKSQGWRCDGIDVRYVAGVIPDWLLRKEAKNQS